jgi:uncharacterized protein (TIGR00369 family)
MRDDDPSIDPLTGERFRGFNAHLGFRMAEWRTDYCRLEAPIREQHLNRSGVVHGGVLATILDATLGYAGIYPIEEGGKPRRAVTLTLTTTYIGQTKGGTLVCTAERRGGGKSVFMATGEVRDDHGNLLAIADGTFRYVNQTPR